MLKALVFQLVECTVLSNGTCRWFQMSQPAPLHRGARLRSGAGPRRTAGAAGARRHDFGTIILFNET